MERFEQLREEYQKYSFKGTILTVLYVVWVAVLCGMVSMVSWIKNAETQTGKQKVVLIMVAIGVVLLVTAIVLYKFSRKNADAIKDCMRRLKIMIVSDAADKLFSQYKYNPDRGFTDDDIGEDGLVAGNLSYSDDYLEGVCPNGIRFRRADNHIGDNHHDAWIIYDSPKCLQKPLVIRPRSVLTFKTIPEIETEDSEFNKLFRCFCEDKAEAFYALTPKLMRALIELHKNLKRLESSSVEISFVKDKVHVVLCRATNPLEVKPDGDTTREIQSAYATIELSYVKMIGEALSLQDDVKEQEPSKSEQREQQKKDHENRERWWDSAEYGDPSAAPSADEPKDDV